MGEFENMSFFLFQGDIRIKDEAVEGGNLQFEPMGNGFRHQSAEYQGIDLSGKGGRSCN